VSVGATLVSARLESVQSAPSAGSKSRFRGDIQGLRAVAVAAVALDHAHVRGFSGGFVGVDVFFVISGFLITQLLLVEWQRTGSISLTGFYGRRARRILPAATLVLVVTVVTATALLNFVRAKALIEDSVWATFFAANIKFGREQTDYFAADGPPSALQHYWSLAVEEQFYLVWPLLLSVLLTGFVRGRRRRTIPERPAHQRASARVLVVLVLIGGASIVSCLSLTSENPTAAYFSTTARAWELGLGAVCAASAALASRLPANIRCLAVWTGLGMVAYAMHTFSATTVFPGRAALVPTIGTALVIVGGFGGRPAASRWVLENKPAQLIGDWSYSFYLWHWPFLVLAAALVGRPLSQPVNLILLGAALAVSALTYYAVENPLRRSTRFVRNPRRALVLYPAAVALTVLTCAVATAQVDRELAARAGAPAITTAYYGDDRGGFTFSRDETRSLVQASVLAAQNRLPVPGRLAPSLMGLIGDKADVGECDYDESVHRLCQRGDVGSDRTMVVFGDSHARHWIPALDVIAQREGYAAYFLVKGSCNAAQMTPDRDAVKLADCLDWRAWAIAQIRELAPEVLILSGDVPDHVTVDGEVVPDDSGLADAYEHGLAETIGMLGSWVGRVIVIGDVPGVDIEPIDCLADPDHDLGDCAFKPTRRARLELAAAKNAASRTGSSFVNPWPWLCADGLCPTVIGSTIAYRDTGHLTPEYVVRLATPLDSALGLVPQSAR
jgi:peptidoglycan/LPS O-acetylase OafA/YrhL